VKSTKVKDLIELMTSSGQVQVNLLCVTHTHMLTFVRSVCFLSKQTHDIASTNDITGSVMHHHKCSAING